MRRHFSVTAVVVCGLIAMAGTVPARAQAGSADKAAIQALYQKFGEAFDKKDVTTIMSVYAPDVFVFDVVPPRQYVGYDAYKKDWDDTFAMMPGPSKTTFTDLNITVVGSVAYTHYIVDGTMTDKDGQATHMVVRSTDVLRKDKGKWLIVEEHNSFPVDMGTGQADMLSKP
jgi:uncharacterized protein (TIGR02246 family)